MDTVHFFTEDSDFELPEESITLEWIHHILTAHEQEAENINFIFCSDAYLLDINRTYLDHDYLTDIITFDNAEYEDDPLESDIFISVDRVKDNATDLDIPFIKELHRVIAHGLLHLLGWNDKTDEQKVAMRQKEEACLSLHPNYR